MHKALLAFLKLNSAPSMTFDPSCTVESRLFSEPCLDYGTWKDLNWRDLLKADCGLCVFVSEHGSAAFASFPNVLYSSVPFYLSMRPAVSLPWVEMWTLILDHTFITQESAKS